MCYNEYMNKWMFIWQLHASFPRGYTCQLSRLRRESHAWLKNVSSCRLARHNFQKYVNSDPCKKRKPCVKWINDNTFLAVFFEVKSTGSELAFIRVLRLGLGNARAVSAYETDGCFRKTSDFFGNIRKWSCGFEKSQHSQDKNLTPIFQKKVGRYKRDASFVLQFTGMFIHLTAPVEKKYSTSAYS